MLNRVKTYANIAMTVSITIFFGVMSYTVYDLSQFMKIKTDEVHVTIQHELAQVNSLVDRQLTDLRSETAGLINGNVAVIDGRISSIETNLFTRVSSIESNTFTTLNNIEGEIKLLSQDFRRIPLRVDEVVAKIDPFIDCEFNDSCFQNLAADMVIDTRFMVRDGAKAFEVITASVPVITENITDVAEVVSVSAPEIAENSTKITKNVEEVTANIARMTEERWYDRIFKYAFVSTGIWYNISRIIN